MLQVLEWVIHVETFKDRPSRSYCDAHRVFQYPTPESIALSPANQRDNPRHDDRRRVVFHRSRRSLLVVFGVTTTAVSVGEPTSLWRAWPTLSRAWPLATAQVVESETGDLHVLEPAHALVTASLHERVALVDDNAPLGQRSARVCYPVDVEPHWLHRLDDLPVEFGPAAIGVNVKVVAIFRCWALDGVAAGGADARDALDSRQARDRGRLAILLLGGTIPGF